MLLVAFVLMIALGAASLGASAVSRRSPRSSVPLGSDYTTEELLAMLPVWQPPLVERLPPVIEVAPPDVPPVPGVYFKPGEPQSLTEYIGQDHVRDYLLAAIRGLAPEDTAIEPQLLMGFPGAGKTLLAKCVAAELQQRASHVGLPLPAFIEAFPADLPDVAAIDRLMRRVLEHPGSVLFIDEVHDLVGPHTRKLYLVLEEQRYLFQGDTTPTQLPATTLMAATTDQGGMHPALRRRWIKHHFRPAAPSDLVRILRYRPFPMESGVAEAIVERTKFSGAPWEALEVYRESVTFAKGRMASAVSGQDLQQVVARHDMDELGLRWTDRRVIDALLGSPRYQESKKEGRRLKCYGASENDVCLMSGIDKLEVREVVRPKLMVRGLLQIRAGVGMALTEAAVERYGTPAQREVMKCLS